MKQKFAVVIMGPLFYKGATLLLETLSSTHPFAQIISVNGDPAGYYTAFHRMNENTEIIFLVPPEAKPFHFARHFDQFLSEINASHGGVLVVFDPAQSRVLPEVDAICGMLIAHSPVPHLIAADVQPNSHKTAQQETIEKMYLDVLSERWQQEIFIRNVMDKDSAKATLLALLKQFPVDATIENIFYGLMQQVIIFVTSPSLFAGKTTFIKTISEIEAVHTEINGIPPVLDFGQIDLSQTEVVYLFGNLGRFEAKWIKQLGDFFNTSYVGVIVLFSPAHPETFREAKSVIEYVRQSEVPYLVAANIRENTPQTEPDSYEDIRTKAHMPISEQYEYIEAMHQYFSEPTIKICNATQKASVKEVVVELLNLMPPEPLLERAISKVQSL